MRIRYKRLMCFAMLWACLVLAACGAPDGRAPGSETAPAQGDYVILLHGLMRTPRAMRPLERSLSAAGYTVFNLGYPSSREAEGALVARLDGEVRARCTDRNRRVHFVTHSLGGILVRDYLGRAPAIRVGRVVMLAPPNRGSELVDVFKRSALLRWLLGPAGVRLGTQDDALPRRLGPLSGYEVGVIAGNATLNPLFSWVVAGEDDGKVSVASTRVEGMRDFLVVPASHPFLMRNTLVLAQTLRFLRTGRFDHGPQ